VIATAVASFAYVYSNKSSTSQRVPESSESSDPLLVTRGYVTFEFISPSAGWALVVAPNSSFTPGQFAIFRTVDRGNHWTKQQSGDGEFFNYGAMPVQSVDAAHSFILVRGVTDRLFRTADGGVHWDTVTLPKPNVGSVAFSDPKYGWLLAWPDLYVTRDSGTSWQPLPRLPQDVSYQLSLRSPTEAWVNGAGPGAPHVYTSADEGTTWQRHTVPPPPGGFFSSTSFFTSVVQLLPRTGVVVTDAYRGGEPSFRATSFDGGGTWRHIQPPPGTVAYQDALHWWALRGKILSKSSDAGQTWTQVTNALPDWLYRPDLYVMDAKHAWVSISVPATLSTQGGNGLAFTDDGGLHWKRARVPQSS